MNKIIQGDCLEVLKTLEDNSVDSIVTDPPYGIGFMGKAWDTFTPEAVGKSVEYSKVRKPRLDGKSRKTNGAEDAGTYDLSLRAKNEYQDWCYEWGKECFRVLKPGGHILISNSTRMYHRMAVAIEDAGFEIRDMIEWVYGSGFPKSLNIGKAVDKLQGNEREVVGERIRIGDKKPYVNNNDEAMFNPGENNTVTKGTSEWEGWGTALKPAHEPICMARKPLSEKTVAENVLKWGTGGIDIDGSRVECSEIDKSQDRKMNQQADGFEKGWGMKPQGMVQVVDLIKGRFPANLIHDNSEEVRECFPESKSVASKRGGATNGNGKNIDYGDFNRVEKYECGFNDSGNASRFFKSIIYTAKASKSERNRGCEELTKEVKGMNFGGELAGNGEPINIGTNKNFHPTVKPIALMEYLIKMVTPKGGTVLDPFAGSGTTLIACEKLNRKWIGIEKEEEYVKIAEARIKPFLEQEKLI